MTELPQWAQNLINFGFVMAGPIVVGVVAWCLCAVGERNKDKPVEVISEDLDMPRNVKRIRQHHVDGG